MAGKRLLFGYRAIAAGCLGSLAGVPALADTAPPPESPGLAEIVVTATRHAEAETRVPISMMAIDQATMDKQGVKDVADVARMVPGLNLQANDDDGDTTISIRGIVSDVGASTTGIYIDDVPVQAREEAVSTNPYPKIFDLDRVEVLRGPQGTLFGAGSEGGTVRFITPEASLHEFSGFASTDVATTDGGAPSWELGAAMGGPLVDGKLGFRASAWYRDDGGYTTRLNPVTHAVEDTDTNSTGSTVVHLAFKLAPVDELIITPSVYLQDVRQDDKSVFWQSVGPFNDLARILQPRNDEFVLPSLGIEYDFDAFSVKSITSYLKRSLNDQYDSTAYQLSGELPNSGVLLPSDPSYLAVAHYHETQLNFTQELRFTSTDGPDDRLSWVGGLFYQHARSASESYYDDPKFGELANYLSLYYYGVPGGTDYYFGENLLGGRYSYFDHYVLNQTDMAAYGNATYEIVPDVKLSAGLRVARSGFTYFDYEDGPWGPAAPVSYSGSEKETPVTPRFSLTWQVDPNQMLYATAAKGYRSGGGNEPVPASDCHADLAALGLDSAPTSYNSDSVWSYEAGAKGRFFDEKVLLEASIFWIDWSQIQEDVYLPRCGYYYIANLGEAASRGFDIQAEWAVTNRLTLSGTAGLTDARYTKTLAQNGQILAKAGDSLATPEWTATAAAEYTYPIMTDTDAYARIDYQFSGPYYSFGSAETYGYDPETRNMPATHYVTLRAGMKRTKWDVSIYADNLFNSRTTTLYYRDTTTEPGLRDATFRPLTVGLSAKYNF